MMTDELKAVFERVQTWAPERQQDAARLLLAMEEQDAISLHLTDERVGGVERRLREPNPEFVSLDEVRGHFARTRR
jgi:hypothetical protein